MADLYDILNSGIFDNYKPSRPTFTINTQGISGAVPNYDLMKLKGFGKALGRGAGILGGAIPFYKNVALPVANDMYKAIKGDTDSKILQSALDFAGIDYDGKPIPKEVDSKPMDKSVPFEVLKDQSLGDSDLIGKTVPLDKQAAAIVNSISNNVSNSGSKSVEQPAQTAPSTNTKENVEIINEYIDKLLSSKKPYVNALETYIKNYYKNLDQARRADLYFYGANLAKGLNPKAGEKFNPLQNQADIINTIKLISDAKAGDINAINELQGNMAVANQIDLPPEAAFANKNLLTALSYNRKYDTDLEKARIVDAMRRYGYDTNFLKTLLAQEMKGDTAEKVARIYMGGETAPAVGLTPDGSAVNLQTYTPAPQQDAYAQAFAQYANKRK